MSPDQVSIKSVSRLHFGLIDLNGDMGRIDGGVGLALKEPCIELTAETSQELSAEGPISNRVRDGAAAIIDHIGGENIQIEVTNAFPQHVGLGSGTQAAISGGLAALRLNNKTLPIPEISDLTGRGGTSGIGTAAFEHGGFILDGGHDLNEKTTFLPSSASGVSPPPVLSRLDFPDWKVAVILPEGKGAHETNEVDIFQDECPLPAHEVEKVCRIILMNLLPSIAESNFTRFREAVNLLQQVGFKQREIELQPDSKQLIEQMFSQGCAAGMSSFGPAVYAIHPDEVDTKGLEHTIYTTTTSRTGATVTKL